MLQNRNIIVILVAVALGLAAVFVTNKYLTGVEKQQERQAQAAQMVKIAVARVPLEYGAKLTAETIHLVDWPAASVPQGAFRTLQGLVDGKPRTTLRPLEAGEPVLPGKITGPGGRASISELIEPEMRAMAVRINDVSGVAGFVLPGDRVDVLVTRTPLAGEGMAAEPVTDVLLQNIRVIGINQNADDKSDKPSVGKTATLAVDPVGAQKLVLASQVGSLSLALRNSGNNEPADTVTVSSADLRDGMTGGSAPRTWVAAAGTPGAGPVRPPVMLRRGPVVRTAPKDNTVSVQVVRGVESTNYEVKRYGGF